VADDLFARGLSLPCSTNLTDGQQTRVIAAVRDFLRRAA
jgi:dTDP-4-amino-4,6-dideoxygalactose transaminase